MIEEEVLRSYPYESVMGDFSLSNGSLNLEDTLPQGDLWGDYVPNGGYLLFKEGIDTVGSTRDVFKRHREFETGSITDFDYYTQDLQLSALETRIRKGMHVMIADQLRYVETAWHQQEGVTISNGLNGVTNDYDYNYQSQERMKLEILSESTLERKEVVNEEIVDKQGWVTLESESTNMDVQGRVTLYRPTNDGLEANENPESDFFEDTISKNVRDISAESTVISSTTNYLGAEGAVEEERTTTTTVRTERKEDAGTQAPFSVTKTTHVTVDVKYRIRNGYGLKEVAYREMDWRENHQNIELETEVLSFTYESNTPALLSCDDDSDCSIGFGGNYECRPGYASTKRCLPLPGFGLCGANQVSYGLDGNGDEVCQSLLKEEGTVTIWKTTDNPLTRNNIDDWKSTEESFSTTYVSSGAGFDTVYETTGPKWLVERIEIDPEFDGVGFAIRGNTLQDSRNEHLWFGDDMSGTQTITSSDNSVSYQVGWEGYLLAVDGSHSQVESTIENETGDAHSVGSNTQGSYSVEMNGQESILVSSDEWLSGILLQTGFGISTAYESKTVSQGAGSPGASSPGNGGLEAENESDDSEAGLVPVEVPLDSEEPEDSEAVEPEESADPEFE